MAQESNIQWTEQTWNPVTGCHKVSPGCKNCYAADIAHRFWADRPFTDVRCHEDRLDQPLKRKKPTTYFVNSMSDLFDEAVPDGFIDQVFAVMALAKQHTFQVLTKRAVRMLEYLTYCQREAAIADCAKIDWSEEDISIPRCFRWPLPNVWLGVSVEDQQRADERIPHLLQTPAAVRFLSVEPLLGGVILKTWIYPCPYCSRSSECALLLECPRSDCRSGWVNEGIGWVICGGESGSGARPFNVANARRLRDECQKAKVPFFLKQLGRFPFWGHDGGRGAEGFLKLKDPKGGDPAEWPEDLRVRQFPGVGGGNKQ